MKAGTTALFRWLGEQPEVSLPAVKEPEFFTGPVSDMASYADLFPAGPGLTGEASVAYTDPALAPHAAARIATELGEARLIFVMRHPIERARSHYRHEVQRGREKAPFPVALADPDSVYVRRSLYSQGIAPYLERFDAARLLLIRFEDLVGDSSDGWDRVIAHLGLTARPRPGEAHNVTADKAGFRAPLRWLWEHGYDRNLDQAPRWVRHLGRRLLMRDGGGYRQLLATSGDAMPGAAAAVIWDDATRLQQLLASANPIWDGAAPESDRRQSS